ncbi:MAG TPA: formate dehydrogenase accessory sulfurtransferase FdhD [Thermoplasmata archaeon]|nr:formate dehydrogenase accessory sulfurtransferase FdhD [Thermoplasmata archaeon]
MNPAGAAARVDVTRVSAEGRRESRDLVAGEEPMEIRLAIPQEDGTFTRSLSVTMRTPGDDFELAAGFLFTEGIVAGRDDIGRTEYTSEGKRDQEGNVVTVSLRPGVRLDPERLLRHFYVTSSCGVCGKASLEAVRVVVPGPLPAGRPLVSEQVLRELPARLREAQAVFAETGGLHAAGLFTPEGEPVVAREDVGRHNAVDKVVGERLLKGAVPLSGSVLQVSGRASFEIVQKALVAGIPVVSAVGAPSSLAVDLAREFGMTLVGFARPEGFNVYHGADRIVSGRPPSSR